MIAGPHGVRVDGAICLADTARAAGTLAWQGRQVELNVPVDGPLTDAIAAKAKERGIPIALAGYGGNRRDQSVLPLDWGILTPLWFLGHGRNMRGHGDVLADPPAADIGPPAVIVTPSRSLPRETLVDFGRAVAEVECGRAAPHRVYRILRLGPCARRRGSVRLPSGIGAVDAEVVAAVQANDLMRLIDLDEGRARDAAIDGLWQALMLGGALDVRR